MFLVSVLCFFCIRCYISCKVSCHTDVFVLVPIFLCIRHYYYYYLLPTTTIIITTYYHYYYYYILHTTTIPIITASIGTINTTANITTATMIMILITTVLAFKVGLHSFEIPDWLCDFGLQQFVLLQEFNFKESLLGQIQVLSALTFCPYKVEITVSRFSLLEMKLRNDYRR